MAHAARPPIRLRSEVLISLAAGCAVAVAVPPVVFGRIDEMLITFVSIVVAASVPGVALTAAAPRPAVASGVEADQLGLQLSDQVRFWFGFLGWGSFAALLVVAGRALGWQLETVRPDWTPAWVPSEGGRWLVLAASSAIAFNALRTRRGVRAVLDLVALGTKIHKEASEAKRTELMAAIREQAASMPIPAGRGAEIERPRTTQ